MGNGNLYHTVFDTLATAASQGVAVVRSSRVPSGSTTEGAEIDDAKYGFVAAGALNPQKARVLLQLALTQTQNHKKFKSYSTHIDTVSLLRRRRSSQNFRQTFIATPLLILQFIRSRTIDRMVLVISEGNTLWIILTKTWL